MDGSQSIPEDTSIFFKVDPEWEADAKRRGVTVKPDENPEEVIIMDPSTISEWRRLQIEEEAIWSDKNPNEALGYETKFEDIRVRDGATVRVKIYKPISPIKPEEPLPLLFVCHAGGWIIGTFTTDERRLVQPLMKHKQFIAVSVEYRLAPEYPYPTFRNDCWDVFEHTVKRSQELGFDKSKIVLGGTSAGGNLIAITSQKANAEGFPIRGVILNVPVLCDYRHWPAEYSPNKSYQQCTNTELTSGEMRGIWDLVVPVEEGKLAHISPLLGELDGLPPHAIFMAGQDPMRDEGIMYVKRLRAAGIATVAHVYPGVPHTFGERWQIQATQKYHRDLVAAWDVLMK